MSNLLSRFSFAILKYFGLFFIIFVEPVLVHSQLKPTSITSIENYTYRWRAVSFWEDAGLENRYVNAIDFEENGTVWVATSDGLYRYDGFVWKRYTKADGIPSNYVRCVYVARDGMVWIGTDKGLRIFDGYDFLTVGKNVNLAGPSIRRIVEDGQGLMWFCCDPWPDPHAEGGLTVLRYGMWESYTQDKGFPSDHVLDFQVDKEGYPYALTKDGLLKKVDDDWIYPLKQYGLHQGETFCSIVSTPEYGLMISSDKGIYIKREKEWTFVPNPAILPNQSPFQLCYTHDGKILSFHQSNDGRQYRLAEWINGCFEFVSPSFTYETNNQIEMIKEAPDGSVWCVGKNLLLRWSRFNREWTEFSQFPIPTFYDRYHRVWFLGKNRFIRYASNGWEPWTKAEGNYFKDALGTVWSWNNNHIKRWDEKNFTLFDTSITGLDRIKKGFSDSEGNIWFFGESLSQDFNCAVYYQEASEWESFQIFELNNKEILEMIPDENIGIWFYVRDINSLGEEVFHIDSQRNIVQQIQLPEFIEKDEQIFIDSAGILWLYGPRILYNFNTRTNSGWTQFDGPLGETIKKIYEVNDSLWFICSGETGGQIGFSRWQDGEFTHFYDEISYSRKLNDGSLVMAGKSSLHVIPVQSDIDPYQITLLDVGKVNGIVAEPSGIFWIHVENDVYRFEPDKIEPDTGLLSEPEIVYKENKALVECTAIELFVSKSQRKKYYYSWKLGEEAWTPFSPNSVYEFNPNLMDAGVFFIKVKARDEGLDIDDTPARIVVDIPSIPLQERWWFKLAAAGIISLILFLGLVAGIAAIIAMRAHAQAVRERKALQWISQNLAGPLNAKEIAVKVAEESRRIFEHDAFSLELLDPSRKKIQGIYNEDTPPGEFHPVDVHPLPLRSFNELYRRILSGEPVLINRTKEEDETGLTPFGFTSRLSRSLMFVPVQWQNESIGVLSVQSYTCHQYNEKHLHLLQSFADQCSGALARVKVEEELQQSEEKLRQSLRLESVGRLAGGIAHDFNNLLMAITGYSDLAIHHLNQDDPVRRFIDEISKAGKRAASLTQQLLAFSRKQVMQPKEINLNDLIDGMSNMLELLAGEDIILSLILEPNLGSVLADPGQMEQVLMNLAVNARDAMPTGGKLTIETSNIEFDENLEHNQVEIKPGSYVMFAVSDTGCGMDKETLTQIYEPFFTTKEKGKGTGLGLSTVYGIVKQSQGFIFVYSELGGGTTFKIYLPRVTNEQDVPSTPGKTHSKRRGTETILLVEDETTVRTLVTRRLREYGYRIIDTASGHEALKLAEKEGDAINLLITDVMMPEMNGKELAQVLQEKYDQLKVIYMSGYTDNAISHQGILTPGTVYVQKPFAIDTLLREIRNVLDK